MWVKRDDNSYLNIDTGALITCSNDNMITFKLNLSNTVIYQGVKAEEVMTRMFVAKEVGECVFVPYGK